jgi:hypothetical protein
VQNLTTPSQDGWTLWPSTYLTGHQVVDTPTPALSNGYVAKQPLNVGNPGGICVSTKPIGPITFGSSDTAIETYVWMNAGNSSSMYGGFNFASQNNPAYSGSIGLVAAEAGMFSPNGQLRVKWLPNNYGNPSGGSGKVYEAYWGQTSLTWGNWYELKGVMDFSVPGVQVSWSIRDITNGETSFTPIVFDKYDVALSPPYPIITPNVTSMNMGLTPTGGLYTVNGMNLFSQRGSSYNIYWDNFRLDDPKVIPEPSTLALLAGGLIGLLAYAWRKRK